MNLKLAIILIINVHDDAQLSNDNDIEIQPVVDLDDPQSKNQRYDKKRLWCSEKW